LRDQLDEVLKLLSVGAVGFSVSSLPQPPVYHNDYSLESGHDLSPNGSAVHAWPTVDPTLAKGPGLTLVVWKQFSKGSSSILESILP
jgi:hypothetical protein